MKIGQYITFNLDQWENENHSLNKIKSIILDICIDPLNIKEPKCGVEVGGELYGIPFSEVLEISPANGEQLELFKVQLTDG